MKKKVLQNEFDAYRAKMNEKIFSHKNKITNRIFNIDNNVYQPGALDTKTKELMGLVASMVLRCDDCIKYHLQQCHKNGVNTDELFETFNIACMVGGSVVIPHFRRALEFWEEL